MATTYTTADDVAGLLQTTEFTLSTTPTLAQVEKIINRKEDRIDQKLMHAWREVSSKEMFLSPTFIDFRNGLRYDLPNYTLKDFSDGSGDILEVWNGTEYIDYLADKVEGRNNDFWVDYTLGVLFIRTNTRPSTKKGIRVKFRYGEEDVTGEIEDLTTMLSCVDVLNQYEQNIRWSDDGGSNSNPNRDRIKVWKEEIKDLYNSLSNISTL